MLVFKLLFVCCDLVSLATAARGPQPLASAPLLVWLNCLAANLGTEPVCLSEFSSRTLLTS